jgi:hypothetical protein
LNQSKGLLSCLQFSAKDEAEQLLVWQFDYYKRLNESIIKKRHNQTHGINAMLDLTTAAGVERRLQQLLLLRGCKVEPQVAAAMLAEVGDA